MVPGYIQGGGTADTARIHMGKPFLVHRWYNTSSATTVVENSSTDFAIEKKIEIVEYNRHIPTP